MAIWYLEHSTGSKYNVMEHGMKRVVHIRSAITAPIQKHCKSNIILNCTLLLFSRSYVFTCFAGKSSVRVGVELFILG